MSELDPELVRAELERMRQLIATDPAVRAHFDTDGDGVIDSEEWERVRQLVIRRMERKKAEGDEAARLQEEYRQRLADEGPASGERDFSDLELAFDPRAQPRGEVAETIYRRDLQNEFEPIRHVGEDQTLAAHPELVLEQGGGLKRLFGSMFRRHFDIKLPSGEVSATLRSARTKWSRTSSAGRSSTSLTSSSS